MVLRSYIRMYKPGILGLYFRLFIFFLIAGTVITPIYGCSDKDNNEIITPDPDPDPDPDDPDSEVIILDPSDVQDYDKIYKAQEFAAMDMLRSDSKWSFVRSKQSEHFIVFWESGFGSDPNASTVSSDLRVDIDDLLARAV